LAGEVVEAAQAALHRLKSTMQHLPMMMVPHQLMRKVPIREFEVLQIDKSIKGVLNPNKGKHKTKKQSIRRKNGDCQ